MQVYKRFHDEAEKLEGYATSLEKEYIAVLEKKYAMLYHSTANLLHAMNNCKNIFNADKDFTDYLDEEEKMKIKSVPSNPSPFQRSQDKKLSRMPSFVAIGLKHASEHYQYTILF